MTFKDQMAIDMRDVFLNDDEFAVSATYEPFSGGAPVALKVVPASSQIMQEFEGFAGESITITGSRSDVDAPEIHSKIILETGEICKILNINSSDHAAWEVFCVADTRTSPQNQR